MVFLIEDIHANKNVNMAAPAQQNKRTLLAFQVSDQKKKFRIFLRLVAAPTINGPLISNPAKSRGISNRKCQRNKKNGSARRPGTSLYTLAVP